MLYVQLFQNNRIDHIRDYQRRQLSTNHQFSLCSNQYTAKFPQLSRLDTLNNGYSRNQTLFFLSRKLQLEAVSYIIMFFFVFDVFICFCKVTSNFDLI